MSSTTLDRLKTKARSITEDDRREAAAKEARKRWEEIRSALSSTAEQLSDAAEEQWEQARDAAAPKVDTLRRRAAEVVDTDLSWLRDEVGDLAGDLRRSVVGITADVKTASRAEADRIIRAIQDSAEEAREAERRRRVRALVGWTAFGMAAGAILAIQFGPKAKAEPLPVPAEVDATPDGDEEPASDGRPGPGRTDEQR